MTIVLNFETQQVEHDVSPPQQTTLTSTEGDNCDNERNIDGDKQPAIAPIQNVEEAPLTSADDTQVQDPNQQPIRRHYIRLTQHQTNELESFFKECSHPNENQRRELGNTLRMDFTQIKFWFQNKRNQMRAIMEHHNNSFLIAENDKLRAENLKYKQAMSNAKCLSCGGQHSAGEMSFEEQQLRIDNARLREEIEKMTAKNVETPVETSFYNLPPPPHTPTPLGSLDVVNYVPQPVMTAQVRGGSDPQRLINTAPFNEYTKTFIVELAVVAMEEFTKMAHDGASLWIHGMDTEILNQQAYVRTFPVGIGPRPSGFRYEASRESMIVIMNPKNLIEILMNVSQWSTVFSSIVSRARIIGILSTEGAGNYNGSLQVMSAEFQVLSHLVPTRGNYFLRYCKHHPDGTWAVVDVSLDYMRPGVATRCKRRPSGCMIQELANGFSKVTWIEHVEVEDIEVHDIFKYVVNSGFVFGARRWIGILSRQCERLACTMASNILPRDNSGITLEQRKNLMKLAEKIMQSYCNYVGATPPTHIWTIHTTPTGVDDVRVMTRNHTDASNAVISATTSFSLPVPSKKLFDFLQNKNSRNQWDILTKDFLVQESAHIANGRDPENFVSILNANSASANQSSKIIVQETWTDSTGSYMVYAPVEHDTMNLVLNGCIPDYGTMLASGFAILPNGSELSNRTITDVRFGGCICTIAYQALVEATPTPLAPSIVSSVCDLMKCSIEKIKAAMTSVSP